MALKPILLLCAALAHALAEDLQFCGNAPYYPSEYTCYDNNALCPKLYGQATLPCSGACYSPDMYECSSDGQLHLLPVVGPAGAPFKLVAHSANPALNNRPAEVCGLQFNVGADAETCVYCYNAPPQYVCSSYQNETVLTPSGAMAVYVPGSQFWFLDQETGRLRTTDAGKASGDGRALAGKGVTIYHEGYFSHVGSSYWLACKEQPDKEVYGIFAPVGSSDPAGCERIKLATILSTVPHEGAYSYT